MWIKWIVIISALIIVSLGIAAIYGSDRWQSDTDHLRTKLASGQQANKPKIYDPKEIEGLPAGVTKI